MSGQLKRKFEEVNEDPSFSSPTTLASSPNNPAMPILKRSKKTRQTNVTFGQVTVFSFPRCQGFTVVPHHGGCTLGMIPHHSTQHTYTLTEFDTMKYSQCKQMFLKEVEKVHRELTQKESQQCGFAENVLQTAANIAVTNLNKLTFPLNYSPRHRYALLKAADVQNIDMEEEKQLQNPRISRQNRGYDCKGIYEPATFSCSLAGIKCHVKHSILVCCCTKDGCGNTQGRIQSNDRVRTHYRNTMPRLKLEK